MRSSKLLNHFILSGLLIVSLACTPFLSDHYTVAKWVALYIVSAASLAMVIGFRLIQEIPRLEGLRAALTLLVFSFALSVLTHWSGTYANQLLDWACFCVIAFAAFHAFAHPEPALRLLFQYNAFSTILVLGYGYLQTAGIEPFPALIHNEFPSSFFGFQNMTAEFVGLSLVVQAFALLRGPGSSKKWLRWARVALLVATAYYLWALACRAVLLAVLPSALIWTLRKKDIFRDRRSKIRVVYICLAFVLALGVFASTKSGIFSQGLERVKSSNVQARIYRWANTLFLIKGNPLGVGPGNYEFGYVPYHNRHRHDHDLTEDTLVRSPHNGFLEAFAEGGLLFGFAVLWLLVKVLAKLLRPEEDRKSYRDFPRSFLLAILTFLLVDAFFAFPLENAYPFYFTALAFGLFLRVYLPKTATVKTLVPVFVGTAALLAMTYQSFLVIRSKYLEANEFDNYEKITLACDTCPSNWFTCLRKGELEIDKERWLDAEKTLQRLLKSAPNNYFARRVLGVAYMRQNKIPEGCTEFKRYDDTFNGNTKLHDEMKDVCAGLKL